MGCTLLYNCTLIRNTSGQNGGGAAHSNLRNCTLAGNSSSWAGGGAYGVGYQLYNCLLTGNSTGGDGGGGTFGMILYNCTVINNKATVGGGTQGGTMYNCIGYFNSSAASSNWNSSTFTNSCTLPAAAGAGNITGDPMLVNTNIGNYRLLSRSPCINAGTNYSWMTDPTDVRSKDLDFRQRLRYGTVDMGTYEHIRAGTVYGVR